MNWGKGNKRLCLPGSVKFIGDVTSKDQMPENVTETAVILLRDLSIKHQCMYVSIQDPSCFAFQQPFDIPFNAIWIGSTSLHKKTFSRFINNCCQHLINQSWPIFVNCDCMLIMNDNYNCQLWSLVTNDLLIVIVNHIVIVMNECQLQLFGNFD